MVQKKDVKKRRSLKKLSARLREEKKVGVECIFKKSSRGGFPIRRVPLLVQFPIKVLVFYKKY